MISRIIDFLRIAMVSNVIIMEKFECPFRIIVIIPWRSLVKAHATCNWRHKLEVILKFTILRKSTFDEKITLFFFKQRVKKVLRQKGAPRKITFDTIKKYIGIWNKRTSQKHNFAGVFFKKILQNLWPTASALTKEKTIKNL